MFSTAAAAPAQELIAATPRKVRRARVMLASLALLIGLAVPAAGLVEAHGTVYTGTRANCGTHTLSAINATATRYVDADFPTGVTSGTTWLATLVQTRDYAGGPVVNHPYLQWSDGSYWIRTTKAQFPYGMFYLGSTWYRHAMIPFFESIYDQSAQARAAFLIQWPDGHQSWAYSKWVTCW